MKTKHTVKFWKIHEHLDGTWSITNSATNQTIVKVWDFPEAKTIAEFIVRACNSHCKLLKACKLVVDHYKRDKYEPAVIACKQAIAKVEEKEA